MIQSWRPDALGCLDAGAEECVEVSPATQSGLSRWPNRDSFAWKQLKSGQNFSKVQTVENSTITVIRGRKTVLVSFPCKCNYQAATFGLFFVIMISEDLTSHTAARVNGDETLYKQLAVRISELIEHGTLRAGERVPSVRKCSEQQSVSIATVMQAYRLLEDQGVIEARPQSGYYVRARCWTPPPEPDISRSALRPINVKLNELVMEVVKASRDASLVRLGAALPSLELFPVKELNRTMASAARRAPVAAHSYDVPPGNRALRVQLARRAIEAGCTLSPDDIITTVGATDALNLCLRSVAKPSDVIAIDSPPFFV